MKKLKLFVITLGIMACTSITAYAKLPYDNGEQGVLIMGNTAYSVSYLSSLSTTELKGINDLLIKKAGQVYYCMDNNGNEFICNTSILKNYNMANLPTSSPTPESAVNAGQPITYYGINSPNGQVYVYQNGEYQPQSVSATATVRADDIGSLKMLYVTLKSADIKGISGAVYFKLGSNPTIGGLGSTLSLLGNGSNEDVFILDTNKKVIATGEINVGGVSNINSLQYFELTPYTSNNISGLGTGNINNNGYAAQVGNWIYYSNTADSGKLYKVKTDGMDNQPISTDKATYINAVEDTIYYSNYSDGGKIYKIKSDGTGRTKVCDDMASYITISGSTLYYSNHSKGGALYKIDINQEGGSGTKLADDNAAYITVDGNTIYYSNYSDGRKIYSVSTDGLCRTEISNEGAMFIQNYNNYLYFSNYSDGGKIYKIDKSNPSVAVKVSDNKTTAMNLAYQYIYYSNYSDGNKLYRMNIDGSAAGTGPITKDSVEFINVLSNDNIYYTKAGKLSIATQANNKWTVTAVTKPALTDKITKIDNLSDIAATDEIALTYPLPDRVPAIMSNNVIKELVVNWDKSKQPVKKGNTYTYSGIVLGYGNKVTFTVTVTASNAIDPNNIHVTNNGGPNDIIDFTGLKPLDTVYVYATSTASAYQVSGQVPLGSTTLTLNTTLDNSGSIWVTVKNAQGTQTTVPSESERVQKTYTSETTIQTGVVANVTNNSGANDVVKITGVNPGDIIKLYKNQNDSSPIKNGTMTAVANSVTFTDLDLGPSEGNTDKLWYGITKGSLGESLRNSVTIPESPNVALVKAAVGKLTAVFNAAAASSLDSNGKIKSDITLPTTCTVQDTNGNNVDVPIRWKVDNGNGLATLINSVVKITRPMYNSGKDLNVKFSATPYLDDYPLDGTAPTAVDTKIIEEVTPQEIVDHDAPNAKVSYASGDSSDSVTADVTLQVPGDYGSTITWTTSPSSSQYVTINGGTAKIKRPSHGAGDCHIVLIPTATYKDKGGTTYTTTYTAGTAITIKQLSATTEDIDTAINNISDTAIISGITSNPYSYLLRSITGSLSTDIKTNWVSDDPSKILIDTAVSNGQTVQVGTASVNAPSYSDGDANVILHLTITEGSETREKDITATVRHLPPTADEAVKATGDQLSYFLLNNNQEPTKDDKGNVLLTTSSSALYLPADSYSDSKFQVPDLSGDHLATITWNSNATGVIDATGSIKGKGTVTLTATITNGGKTYTRNFTFIVQ